MTYDRDLDEQLSLLFCAAVERDEVAEYLLGLKPYMCDSGDIEMFYRLHEVANWLATLPAASRETQCLHLAAAVSATNRELAALIIAAVEEHGPERGWQPISDAVYFAVAVRHGNLRDYLAVQGAYTAPSWVLGVYPTVRQERFCHLYRQTPPGHGRAALRLALLSLFDGGTLQQLLALRTSQLLGDDDAVLLTKVGARLQVARQSGELDRGGREVAAMAAAVLRA